MTRISVVTPVLNGARTIARLMESMQIQKANFEHIVMDGGSRDETETIVRSYEGRYNLKWHQKRDRSLYEGVWNGMSKATGDILCYLNADDQYLPWTLATVRAIFERYPEVEWITGIPNTYSETLGTAETPPLIPHYPRKWIRRGWFTIGCMGNLMQECMFWRRSLWERSRPDDILLKYRLAADFHLWKRFAESAELRTVNSILSSFTVCENQLSWIRREEYLKECGLKPGFKVRPVWARLLFLASCNLMQRKVLFVPSVHERESM